MLEGRDAGEVWVGEWVGEDSLEGKRKVRNREMEAGNECTWKMSSLT